jgi:uncharacterized protein with PQ loop repeat
VVLNVKKNYKEAIIMLIGGIGVVPILMGIFSDSLSFEYGIVIAFVFFLISGTLNGLIIVTQGESGRLSLQRSQKQALINFVGGIGVLVIIMGIFRPAIEFGYTIVIAYVFFLISGILNKLIEVDSQKSEKTQFYEDPKENYRNQGTEFPNIALEGYCSSCNSKIDSESIFCSHCGKDVSKGS